MRVRQWVAAACITPLLTAGALVATASPAAAVPTNCSTSTGYAGGYPTATSLCLSGTGEHRVRVLQRHFNPWVGYIPIIGPWAAVGSPSTTNITGHTIVYIVVETR